MAFQFKCVGRSDASRVSRARRRCPCLCPRRRRHKHIHAYNARPRTLGCILYLYRYFNCILIYPRDSAPLLVTRTRELKGYIGRRAPGKCKLSAPVLANVSPPPLSFFSLSPVPPSSSYTQCDALIGLPIYIHSPSPAYKRTRAEHDARAATAAAAAARERRLSPRDKK